MKRQIKFYILAILMCGVIGIGGTSLTTTTAECAVGTCEENCQVKFNECRKSGKRQYVCEKELNACKEKCPKKP